MHRIGLNEAVQSDFPLCAGVIPYCAGLQLRRCVVRSVQPLNRSSKNVQDCPSVELFDLC